MFLKASNIEEFKKLNKISFQTYLYNFIYLKGKSEEELAKLMNISLEEFSKKVEVENITLDFFLECLYHLDVNPLIEIRDLNSNQGFGV